MTLLRDAAHAAAAANAQHRFPLGSVVRRRNGTGRGIVVKHYRPGDRNTHIAAVVGDMVIRQSAGCETVSNLYHDWERVPADELTRGERIRSLLYEPSDPDDDGNVPEDETLAWRVIYELALLCGVDPIDDLAWPGSVAELTAAIASEFDRADGTPS